MTPELNAVFHSLSATLGIKSKAALALYSPAELYRRVRDARQECDWSALQALHAEARREVDDLRVLEKSILTRASPLLPQAIRFGLKHPDVSLQDYEEWIGDRASRFANPGDVASMFSPAAYTAELYREARQLYPEECVWHIDTRRPDLKSLELSQEKLDTEVTALGLSNDMLMAKARTAMEAASTPTGSALTHDDVLQQLSTHLTSPGTPYHHHHARLRQVRELKDPNFTQLQHSPVVTSHLSGPAMAALTYDISPALYELLTDEITDANAEEKFAQYFGEIPPEYLLDPKALRRWYGITDDEVRAFLGSFGSLTLQDEYIDNVLTTQVDGWIIRLVLTKISGSDNLNFLVYPLSKNSLEVRFSINFQSYHHHMLIVEGEGFEKLTIDSKVSDGEVFLPGKQYSGIFNATGDVFPKAVELRLAKTQELGGIMPLRYGLTALVLRQAPYLLRLNKAIRLYKATGLAPRVLEDIVNSVDPDQITDETLTLLFRTSMLMKRYAISHEDALVMSRGLISRQAGAGEISQWDRLFNAPALVEGGLGIEDKTINLNPDVAVLDAELKATLKRAFAVDDEGLFQLKLIRHDKPEDIHNYLQLTQLSVSMLYTLSLWARLHGLTPGELRQVLRMIGLPEKLHEEPASGWAGLLDRLHAAVTWMNTRHLRVSDLHLMTRDVSQIPASTEAKNFLAQLTTLVRGTDEAETTEARIRALSPVVAAVFNLGSEAVAAALLRWVDSAAPGDPRLDDVWDALRSEPTSRIRAIEQGFASEAAEVITTAFAYALAQMATIYHASGITPDALVLFVDHPERLGGQVPAEPTPLVLARNLPVIRALCDAGEWLKSLPDTSGASGALLVALRAGEVFAARLAQAVGVSELLIAQAMTAAKAQSDVADANKLASYVEIRNILQWLALAQTFSVTPADIGLMLSLNASYQAPNSEGQRGNEKALESWPLWKRVADAFSAGLSPSQVAALENATAPTLSAALSGYIIGAGTQPGVDIADREALFHYLLADNLNGSQVRTTEIAEAMASLQMFIHRVLSLSPVGDNGTEGSQVLPAALDRLFFRDWTQWNARYSTWAAAQKLMYYPENYIDPTVRLGQTRMMDDMLQVLGQAQVNTDTVGDAFMGYLTGFEGVANLETVSGYHDSENANEGKTWFVGRNQSEPREYWWRSVDESKRSHEGVLPANAWTGWTAISCEPQPLGDLIRPVIYKGRLYIGWIERRAAVTARKEDGSPEKYSYAWNLKVAWLRYDGNWSLPATYAYPVEKVSELESLLENAFGNPDYLSFYMSVWPTRERMVTAVYEKGLVEHSGFKAELCVYEDMSFAPSELASGNWAELKEVLNANQQNKVMRPFIAKDPLVELPLTAPSQCPTGFAQFEATNFYAQTLHVNDAGDSYELGVWITLSMALVAPEVDNLHLRSLVAEYPELQGEENQVDAVYGHYFHPAAMMRRMENGQLWGYLILVFPPRATHAGSMNFPEEKEPIRPLLNSAIPNLGTVKYKLMPEESSILDSTICYYEGDHLSGIDEGGKISWVMFLNSGALRVTPFRYVSRVVPKEQIELLVSGGGVISRYTADQDVCLSRSAVSFQWPFTLHPATANEMFSFSGNEVIHTVTLSCGVGVSRSWSLRVYKDKDKSVVIDLIGHKETNGQRAQYLEHGAVKTRLNTLFARHLTEAAASGINAILNYRTQQMSEPPLSAGEQPSPMDFSGANAIYFWELYYYTPMMVMQRFLQEERYDLAEKWLKYIFSPSGYIESGGRVDRLWNVRPLQEDTSWNDEPLKSYDPDAVAQNDPMHYKLNAFMRLLDIVIGKGDAAYRKLERDTLAEAKVWYGRALDLLGEAPWIEPGGGWANPTLGAASSIAALSEHIDGLSQMAQGMRRSPDAPRNAVAGSTLFLPEANDRLLGYWETLRLRLYNLRHNLTLDGQPLSLPLYAPAADPNALLAAAVAAEGGEGNELPVVTWIPALRFTPMLESARSMAFQLIQFGSTLQQILLSQNAEALAELLNSQGVELANSSLALQQQALQELAAERLTLEKSVATVTTRLDHYRGLYQQDVNPRETQAMNLSTSAQAMSAGIKPLYVAGAISGLAPNIFGLANGGMQYEGPMNAAGIGLEIVASGLQVASNRIAQEEQYRRRREEWDIQYRSAEKEIAVIHAQLNALTVRETSLQMHIRHMQTQQAQAQAQLALFQEKFTGKAMYSWLRGRLATIFYQYYDLTASMCLMAQKALQWEKGDTSIWLKTGTWNGAWAGLMSGEGLMLSLGQMEMAWMKYQKRELEVTRTLSLKSFFEDRLEVEVGKDEPKLSLSLSEAIKHLLDNTSATPIGSGKNTVSLTTEASGAQILGIKFSLKELNIAPDFSDKTLRVRSIAVSLPALLGPYQDVRGRLRADVDPNQLPAGCHECAISRGVQDNGLFQADGTGDPRWGARWLPFEGLAVNDDNGMTLSFADAKGDQETLLRSLTDVILHIQFTAR